MGSKEQDFAAIVGMAFAAALDDTLWERVTSAVTERLGGAGGVFFVLDGAATNVRTFLPVQMVAEAVDEYLATWGAFDPQLEKARGLTRSLVFDDREHVDLSRPETAAYCAWQQSRGIKHHLTALSILGDSGLHAGISIHRALGDGPTPPRVRQQLQQTFPYLEAAFELGYRHQAKLAESFWEGVGATRGSDAVLLIDEGGAVVRAAEAALTIFRESDGMALRHGRLHASTAGENARLTALVARAIATGVRRAGAVQVCRRSGRNPYVVTAYPLVRERRLLAPYEAAALVTIIDPARRRQSDPAMLRDAFGLTAREADLAALLREGHSLESAGAVLSMAVTTTRVHLRHIFQKTGTGRQAELIGLLATLG